MRPLGAFFGMAILALIGGSSANAKSLLPGVVYEVDPALPASMQPLGPAPAIQLDGQEGIVAMRFRQDSRRRV